MKVNFSSGEGSFSPVSCLVIYRKENEYGEYNSQDALLTHHEIKDGKLSDARVVDPELLVQFFAAIGAAEAHAGVIFPKGLLGFSGGAVFWFVEPAEREFYFKNPKLTGISGRKFHSPGLVFRAKPGELSVFAVKGGFPDAKTPLYHAPLSNVWDDGRICMPHNSRVVASLEAIRENERIFFDSFGTHASGSQTTSFPGGHDDLYLAMAADSSIRSTDYLVEFKKTLEEVMADECTKMDH